MGWSLPRNGNWEAYGKADWPGLSHWPGALAVLARAGRVNGSPACSAASDPDQNARDGTMAKADAQRSMLADWPAEGLSPIEAIKRIAGAGRWQAYQDARAACRDIPLPLVAPRTLTEEQKARLAWCDVVREAAFGAVLDAWERGELELWAWRGDPSKAPELVQPIARSRLQWQIELGTFRIGIKFWVARFWRPTSAVSAQPKNPGGNPGVWDWEGMADQLRAKPVTFESRALFEEYLQSNVRRTDGRPRDGDPKITTVRRAIPRHDLDKIEGVHIKE